MACETFTTAYNELHEHDVDKVSYCDYTSTYKCYLATASTSIYFVPVQVVGFPVKNLVSFPFLRCSSGISFQADQYRSWKYILCYFRVVLLEFVMLIGGFGHEPFAGVYSKRNANKPAWTDTLH